MLTAQDRINQSVWITAEARKELDDNTDFTDPGEQAAFEFIQKDIIGEPILDLGVGSGRTIKILKPLTHDYRAIDYLQSMVDISRKRYPDTVIELGDARYLSGMPENYFGLVQFSYNGIDSVAAQDRKLVLASVNKVLKQNGLFLFSALNLDGPIPDERPWRIHMPRVSNPARFAVRFLRSLLWKPIEVMRWHRLLKHGARGSGFLVAPLPAHHWGILAHYTSLTRQIEELEQSGFSVVCVFESETGMAVYSGDDTSAVSCFHFIARKTLDSQPLETRAI